MSGAVEVFVRRPHRARHTTFMGPASANLHMNGLTRRSKKAELFDDLVGSHKQGWRHRKPKRFRGLEVDDH
ncbi:MAG: hypothetical protein QOF94_2052 [Acidobacteriaceae bacterium]